MATASATPSNLVEAAIREDRARGKNEARRIRRSGRVPAVVYGAKKPTLAISVDPKQIARILQSESGHNTIFDLQVGDERNKAMIVDTQFDPIKGAILHIDLKRIAMDERLRVAVPIVLKGEAAGVKTQGGILEQVLREVMIECLPSDIPSHIDVDVSELVFGKILRVADLPHDTRLKYITEPDHIVAHIVSVKEVETVAPAEAGAEVATAPAEPEVIKKGKQETEEEAADVEAKSEKPEKAEKKEKK